MKLLASAAALGCVLLWLASLASGRWEPRPVDFELAPKPRSSDDGLGAEARARWARASRSLRVGRRFNLVGMRWRGSARAAHRRPRGRPGTPLEPLGPARGARRPQPRSWQSRTRRGRVRLLWVGEADRLQYRLDRRVDGLRLHFVNVQGTATAANRARTALHHAAAAAVDAVSGGAQPAREPRGRGALRTPSPRSSRAEWGHAGARRAGGPPKAWSRPCTYTTPSRSTTTRPPRRPPSSSRSGRYHRYSNGWDDIGYHALVDRFGVLYEGRAGGLDRPVVGAQAQGYNAQTASIASIGDHRVVEQPAIALEAMARYIRWKPGPRPADLRPGDARQHGRLVATAIPPGGACGSTACSATATPA